MDLKEEVEKVLHRAGLGGVYRLQSKSARAQFGKLVDYVEVLWNDPQASKSTQSHELYHAYEALEDAGYNVTRGSFSVAVYPKRKAKAKQTIPSESSWWKVQQKPGV